eukprot:1179520-Prorocentrum_minimum.AAC.4
MDAAVAEDHTVLGFSQGPQCAPGDAALIDQMCLHMGYPRDVAAGLYLTGENSDLVDEFPELPCLRDVVFMAKLLLVPVLEVSHKGGHYRGIDGRYMGINGRCRAAKVTLRG